MPTATTQPPLAPLMPGPRATPAPPNPVEPIDHADSGLSANPDTSPSSVAAPDGAPLAGFSVSASASMSTTPASPEVGEPTDLPLADPALMPLAGVERELCTLAGQIASATCRFLCLLADFDARKGWVGVNVRSYAQWLSWRCGLDARTAREHLRVAHALARLPRVCGVFATGQISYSKVRAIARVATEQNEAELVDVALHAPAAHLERLTRGLHSAPDPDPAPEDTTPPTENGTGTSSGAGSESESGSGPGDSSAREHPPAASPHAPRRFKTHWHWDDDGSFVFWGRLSPEDGARLLAGATRAHTERLRTQSPGRPTESKKTHPTDNLAGREQHRSDGVDDSAEPRTERHPVMSQPSSDLGSALVAMAEMVCSGLEAPIYAPTAEVIVEVDIDTLFEAFAEDGDHHPARPQSTEAAQKAPTTDQAEQAEQVEQNDQVGQNADQNQPASGQRLAYQGQPAHEGQSKDYRDHSSDSGQCTSDAAATGSDRSAGKVARHHGPRLGRLSDGPALFAATLRKLIDDGRLRTAVLAKDGRTLDLGRAHRTASASQMLALWRRDRGCAVPGCGRIRFLHAHHVVFWSNGGHTNLDNLVLLCSEHRVISNATGSVITTV